MKDLILKRERIFHFLALAVVCASIFVDVPEMKVALLLLGVAGLLLLAILKKHKILIIVYCVLLIAAIIFYFFMSEGRL